MIFKIKTIEICNLRKEKDLDLISEYKLKLPDKKLLELKLKEMKVLFEDR